MAGASKRALREARKWAEHARTCWRRYQLTGELAAIGYGVEASRLALAAIPDDHELAPGLRFDLVAALVEAHGVDPTAERLDDALAELPALMAVVAGDADAHELASRLLRHADEHDGPPLAHHDLARAAYHAAFGEHFLQVGRLLVAAAVQERDIATASRAVRILDRTLVSRAVPPDVRSERLHAHALALAVRWQLGGEPADLDTAIRELDEAVALVENAPLVLHHDLAEAYAHRYLLGADAEDVHRAVAAYADAPHDATEDDAWRRRLIGLRWAAYTATADLADLDAAIDLARGLIIGRAGEPTTDDLRLFRNLLEARRIYRDDPELADLIGELRRVLADEDADPEFAPRSLGWTRTHG